MCAIAVLAMIYVAPLSIWGNQMVLNEINANQFIKYSLIRPGIGSCMRVSCHTIAF